MANPVRILIADDHTIVRQGLASLLNDQPDLKVIGQADNGRAAVDKTLELKKKVPKSKVLILSMYSHEHYIHELLESGVSGYLLKDSSGRDIINAIHAAMNNETFLSPSISKVVVDTYRSRRKGTASAERYKRLSNREREVFQLIAEGHSTRQIAGMLFVSISTIKSHRAKIMEKLEIYSPVKLVHFAIQLGLVDPEL
jgi:DNA-binding NarL/FixJ family response regulator